jgi:WhiB family redox-sensing transcriptional regulator
MARDVHWRDRAACLGSDLALFFPPGGPGPGRVRGAAAKQVCGRCGVREACLRWAQEVRIEDGVFGGLDAGERRAAAMMSEGRRSA